jgi:alpha-N-acetylglucosaminidase
MIFYKVRWEKFFVVLESAMQSGKTPDWATFEKSIAQWEWQWVNARKDFPVLPTGNSVQVATMLHDKYARQMRESYHVKAHGE